MKSSSLFLLSCFLVCGNSILHIYASENSYDEATAPPSYSDSMHHRRPYDDSNSLHEQASKVENSAKLHARQDRLARIEHLKERQGRARCKKISMCCKVLCLGMREFARAHMEREREKQRQKNGGSYGVLDFIGSVANSLERNEIHQEGAHIGSEVTESLAEDAGIEEELEALEDVEDEYEEHEAALLLNSSDAPSHDDSGIIPGVIVNPRQSQERQTSLELARHYKRRNKKLKRRCSKCINWLFYGSIFIVIFLIIISSYPSLLERLFYGH